MEQHESQENKKEIIASTFEKHFQTAMLTMITAFLIAGVFALIDMKEQLVRMDERDKTKGSDIQNLQKSVEMLRTDLGIINNRLTIMEQKDQNKRQPISQ